MRKWMSAAVLVMSVAGCEMAANQAEPLYGAALKDRLSDTRLDLVITNGFGNNTRVWRLHANGAMTWDNQPESRTYGWQVKGNQICTAIYRGGQKLERSENCGSVSIAGDKITLRQKNVKFGDGSILAGTISPLRKG